MGKGKEIVCFCEDVSKEEIVQAIKLGFRDLETLKRFTGISTGPCQGKSCLFQVMRLLAQMEGKKLEEMVTTTIRPPARPILIGALAEGETHAGEG